MDEMGVQVYMLRHMGAQLVYKIHPCVSHAYVQRVGRSGRCGMYAEIVCKAHLVLASCMHCVGLCCVFVTCHGFQASMVPSSLCIWAFDQGSELVCRHLRVLVHDVQRAAACALGVCLMHKSVCQMQVDRSSRRCCDALGWM